jgi:hypothetical protein
VGINYLLDQFCENVSGSSSFAAHRAMNTLYKKKLFEFVHLFYPETSNDKVTKRKPESHILRDHMTDFVTRLYQRNGSYSNPQDRFPAALPVDVTPEDFQAYKDEIEAFFRNPDHAVWRRQHNILGFEPDSDHDEPRVDLEDQERPREPREPREPPVQPEAQDQDVKMMEEDQNDDNDQDQVEAETLGSESPIDVVHMGSDEPQPTLPPPPKSLESKAMPLEPSPSPSTQPSTQSDFDKMAEELTKKRSSASLPSQQQDPAVSLDARPAKRQKASGPSGPCAPSSGNGSGPAPEAFKTELRHFMNVTAEFFKSAMTKEDAAKLIKQQVPGEVRKSFVKEMFSTYVKSANDQVAQQVRSTTAESELQLRNTLLTEMNQLVEERIQERLEDRVSQLVQDILQRQLVPIQQTLQSLQQQFDELKSAQRTAREAQECQQLADTKTRELLKKTKAGIIDTMSKEQELNAAFRLKVQMDAQQQAATNQQNGEIIMAHGHQLFKVESWQNLEGPKFESALTKIQATSLAQFERIKEIEAKLIEQERKLHDLGDLTLQRDGGATPTFNKSWDAFTTNRDAFLNEDGQVGQVVPQVPGDDFDY